VNDKYVSRGVADIALATPRVAFAPHRRSFRARQGAAFGVAMCVLAVHATVDSFVASEPGTTWRDHLPRAAASLAIVVVAFFGFRGSRAGVRAAIAASLGVLALEGAALAIADTRASGARGEDWTGFLLLPVGLVLLGLSAVLLWRSRKSGRLRYLRRGAIALGTVLTAYWLLLPVAIAILATHRPRADVAPVELGRTYEDVTIRTADGLDLAAWYIPSRNGAAVISYPTRQGRLGHARMLARHGFGVLLVDARGYDGSEGSPNVFGWDGEKDIDAAVSWLLHRPDVRHGQIGGIGFSVGGEVMLDAAASNPGLRAVVSEGAGVRSVREHLLRGPRGWFSLPEAAVQTAAVAVMSGVPPPASLGDVVSRIAPRPIFLIYAGQGGGGEELNPDYFRAASTPKLLWRIPEAGHVGGIEARPNEYERRVVGFLNSALIEGAGIP
jgi:fermentation-respiration switch protein FrsA (DUF1100 family)